MKRLVFLLTVALAMTSVYAQAAPRKSPLAAAIESLALGMGDEYDQALAFLNGRQDVFSAGASAIKSVVATYPGDGDVARRLLDFAAQSGDRGCRFAATLVSPDYPVWVAGVLKRYPEGLGCEDMHKAVARIPSWAQDPSSSREAELFIIDVFSSIAKARNVEGATAACEYLDRGPDNVRTSAADLIVAVKPPTGLTCLVKAFDHQKFRGDRLLADYFLESIGRFGGEEAWPHLIAALEAPGQFERACRLMTGTGDVGYQVMIRAVRAVGGRSIPLMDCLSVNLGEAGRHVLPLFKDPSLDIRYFALNFFARNHTDEGLAVMKAGFADSNQENALRMPREKILAAMSTYPVEQIEDSVELGLTDNDDAIRNLAMDVIRATKSLRFSDAVRAVAELDPNRVSRTMALGILWYLGDFESEQLLARMAQYEESTIAAEATRVLGYIGSARSIDVLKKLALSMRGLPRGGVALESLALLGLTTDPLDASFAAIPEDRELRSNSVISCGNFRASVVGSSGPVVMALPGGPGMDSRWARPWMDGLSRQAVIAYVEPTRSTGEEPVVMTPQDFDCIAAAFPDRKIVLVSDGLGGTAAQWLAFQIPNRIDGLVTISSPIPGNLGVMDLSLVMNLPRPFNNMAEDLFAKAAFFRPEAFDYYALKTLAPGYAGNMDDVRKVLRLKYNSRRLASARQDLSRPEVRFVAMEVNKPVLWILPAELMTPESLAPYRALAGERPEMFSIVETERSCGMMPQISCEKHVLKLLKTFIRGL